MSRRIRQSTSSGRGSLVPERKVGHDQAVVSPEGEVHVLLAHKRVAEAAGVVAEQPGRRGPDRGVGAKIRRRKRVGPGPAGTDVEGNDRLPGRLVGRVVILAIKFPEGILAAPLEVGQDQREPAGMHAVIAARRIRPLRVDPQLSGQADLLEIVAALRDPGRLPDRLHGRQKQGHERGHDRDHDQELDERHSAAVRHELPPHIAN